MDDVVHRLSRELADAMAAAVADDSRVGACYERARAAGYDMKVSVEAVIGFADRPKAEDGASETAKATGAAEGEAGGMMNSNDRRFLRSLRIAADEPTPKSRS